MSLALPPAFPRRARRLVAASFAAFALLAGCGGSGSQFEAFVPDRYFAFGDETSLILPGGRKYSVNSLDTNGNLVCNSRFVWTQSLASEYGFVFAECNPEAAEPKAFMLASAGARIADLATQIDARVAAGGIGGRDIASVLLGSHDVLELYAQFPTRSADDLAAEARRRGEVLAAQVNRLGDLGARVILSTTPDIGLSPFALAEKAANTDTDRAALISRLVAALNTGLRTGIVNDGRRIGLVLGDELTQALVRSLEGTPNATTALCTVAPPDCTSATLVEGGNPETWVWAHGVLLSPYAQQQIGLVAQSRARTNPF
jgi:hypothetical protein